MAKSLRRAESKLVYEIAERFVNHALKTDGSLFTPGKPIWSLQNLEDLEERFIGSPDTSKNSFEVKFKRQLQGAPLETYQLAAEVIFAHLLIAVPGTISGAKKRLLIENVLSWKASDVSIPSDLDEVLNYGLVGTGIGFLTLRPFMLRVIIRFVLKLKQLPENERTAIVDDPWKFKTSLFETDSFKAESQLHALLHLVHPEAFECITSKKWKKRIAAQWSDLAGGESDNDRALFTIRQNLQIEHGADFSFYSEALRSQWDPKSDESSETEVESQEGKQELNKERYTNASDVQVWIEKRAPKRANSETEFPEHGLGRALWSPQKAKNGADIYRNMREVRPGDVVLHLTNRQQFAGVSIVAASPDSEFEPPPGTEWSGRPGIRVGLRDYVELNPVIHRDSFFKNEVISQKLLGILEQHRGNTLLFYSKNLELNQGGYLTEAPPALVQVLNELYRSSSGQTLPHLSVIPAIQEADSFISSTLSPFSIDDALKDVFLPKADFVDMLNTLTRKKNLILQGPPGVGKTFLARRLAYAKLGCKDSRRLNMIQFHQSYAYEDFVQGWRPSGSNFKLKNGVFYDFCRQAQKQPDISYVFMIDEINRGNLSKIFGELLMLIEGDKRGPQFAIPLTYAESSEQTFYVPENLYLIGMMNTADRSLSMVDYALRRRFGFKTLEPAFDSVLFSKHLEDHGVDRGLIDRIIKRMNTLNESIAEQKQNLGPGFMIGHSYFCPLGTEESLDKDWYESVVHSEIKPLLDEYWFEDSEQVDNLVSDLLE